MRRWWLMFWSDVALITSGAVYVHHGFLWACCLAFGAAGLRVLADREVTP